MHKSNVIHLYKYIYIYIQRQRERERERIIAYSITQGLMNMKGYFMAYSCWYFIAICLFSFLRLFTDIFCVFIISTGNCHEPNDKRDNVNQHRNNYCVQYKIVKVALFNGHFFTYWWDTRTKNCFSQLVYLLKKFHIRTEIKLNINHH